MTATPNEATRLPAPVGHLRARLFVTATLRAESGLRIGGDLPGLTIGGIDLPVIRDPMTNRPYVPGSSLRGKMRALLDHYFDNRADYSIGSYVRIHMPEKARDYERSIVARLFGVLPLKDDTNNVMRPTRLLVRDLHLDDDEARRLRARSSGGLLYTEGKTEAAIDRLTSAANPRTIERVLAGTRFRPFTAVITLYDQDDAGEYLTTLLTGMRLLEDDYLGGHGARGSGEIAFEDVAITVMHRTDYDYPFKAAKCIASGTGLQDVQVNDAAVITAARDAIEEREAASGGAAPIVAPPDGDATPAAEG